MPPDSTHAGPSLSRRLLSGRAAILLARNTFVSVGTFVFDLALLWVMIEYWRWDKLVAAAVGFIAATSLHYVFARTWIFRGTERAVASGYVYFLVNAVIGLVLTVALFAAFMAVLPFHYMVARVLASVVAGLTIFVLNAVLNFRSL